jgi:hypothetical protein
MQTLDIERQSSPVPGMGILQREKDHEVAGGKYWIAAKERLLRNG